MRRILKLCALGAFAWVVWAAWPWWSRDDCFRQVQQRVRGPGGYDAEVADEVCDVPIEKVSLRARDSGERSPVFSYAPVTPSPTFPREDVPPTVHWLDRTHLLVAINMVENIIEQHETVDGIQIQYRIGRVLYPRAER